MSSDERSNAEVLIDLTVDKGCVPSEDKIEVSIVTSIRCWYFFLLLIEILNKLIDTSSDVQEILIYRTQRAKILFELRQRQSKFLNNSHISTYHFR